MEKVLNVVFIGNVERLALSVPRAKLANHEMKSFCKSS